MRTRVVVLLVALSLTVDLIAAVYGPRTFTRANGAPQLFVEQFQRRVVADRYDLVIENGGVSSASVWLNGAMIAGPSDFSQKQSLVRRAVGLHEGTNEIAIELASAPGGTLSIRISAVAGASGGTIAAGPVSFAIPPGALQGDAEVGVHEVAAEDTGVTLPFAFLGAVQLDLDATLAAEGDLSVAFDGAAGGRALVARVVPRDAIPRLALVDLAAVTDGRLHTSVSPMAGVRTGGIYVFLDMPASLGIVGIRAQTPEGAPAPGTIVDAIAESAAAFAGIADEGGLAAIPGVVPGSEVLLVVTSPAGGSASAGIRTMAFGDMAIDVATIGLPSLPDIVAEGFLPAWLANVVVHGLHGVDPSALPSAPPVCPCLLLDVRPPRIPLAGTFPPGDTLRLIAECDNIDVARKWLDLPLLRQGMQTQLTFYGGYDSTKIDVSRDGLVTARSPGQTDIWMWTATVQLYSTRDPVTLQQFVTPFQCWAAGGVHPVIVSCPPTAPHWNAASTRCEAHFVVQTIGNGAGTVTLAPALAPPCRGTCSGAGAAGAIAVASAAADAGSQFAGWSGACAGSGATSSFNVQEGAACIAQFIVQNRQITVTKQGEGDGIVSSVPSGIYCDETCPSASAPVPGGSVVTLTATPGFASQFAGWSGACAGSAATTVVTMSTDQTCTANFDPVLRFCSGSVFLGTYHLFSPDNPSAFADGFLWGEVWQSRYGRYWGTDVIVWNGDANGPTYRVGGSTDVVWSPQPVPQIFWPVFWKNQKLVAARFDQPMSSASVTFRYLSRGDYWQPTHLTVSVPTDCFP